MTDVRVSINFSGLQVEQDSFIDEIKDALDRYELPGTSLEVEITENVIMNDMSKVIQKLRQLTDMDIKIAVDDFGTGYSSLSYLQQFPINTLKIDKSFVSSINVNEEATSIVDAIIAMAKGLKLNLIAEGVEKRSTTGVSALPWLRSDSGLPVRKRQKVQRRLERYSSESNAVRLSAHWQWHSAPRGASDLVRPAKPLVHLLLHAPDPGRFIKCLPHKAARFDQVSNS